jgi:hypothetical protein
MVSRYQEFRRLIILAKMLFSPFYRSQGIIDP